MIIKSPVKSLIEIIIGVSLVGLTYYYNSWELHSEEVENEFWSTYNMMLDIHADTNNDGHLSSDEVTKFQQKVFNNTSNTFYSPFQSHYVDTSKYVSMEKAIDLMKIYSVEKKMSLPDNK